MDTPVTRFSRTVFGGSFRDTEIEDPLEDPLADTVADVILPPIEISNEAPRLRTLRHPLEKLNVVETVAVKEEFKDEPPTFELLNEDGEDPFFSESSCHSSVNQREDMSHRGSHLFQASSRL